ncbi:fibrocystin-L-like isoform X2 [Dendropsophus ebraccatus]|uniref:fibrocystin-L-like isoform X2 n=1 Tax=Dendropsophus ebraccatus TaxID=150705 RepID=UPI003831D4ED
MTAYFILPRLVAGTMFLGLILLFAFITLTDGQTIVSQVTPYYGGVNGATRVTIMGRGFADANQFNYGDGNSNLGNSVQFISSTLSIPCDVEKDASHGTQIICYTRPMPGDSYKVRVSVDGIPVDPSNICNGYQQYYWQCGFLASMSYTPTISSITPLSGRPGSLITIRGTIFTDAYGSNALSSNGRDIRVVRVYAGGMPCNLLAPNSDTLYGLKLESGDYGSMICYNTGTYVGHLNISFILESVYGRSFPDLATYFVSSLNKLAMYQTYAEITGIFPSSGSIQGGTIVTISGQYFDQTDAPAKVLIGGQQCQILALTDKTITCRSAPQLSVLPPFFPGGRGIKLERWNVSISQNDLVKLNESSTGYSGASWYDVASVSWPSESNDFVARFSGFFVPPDTDYYSFYIKGNGYYALYFSESGDPAGKVQIVYNFYTSSSFYFWLSSKTFYLQAGKPCYFEAYIQNTYHSSASLDVGVYSQKSSYTEQQTRDAVNDVQYIQSQSANNLETQVITLQNWNTTQQAVAEVQQINVTTDCIPPCPAMSYRLIYGTEKTGPLSADATALEIQAAINNLWSIQPDTVTVQQVSSDIGNTYKVTFNSQRGDFQLLSYEILDRGNITVDIKEIIKGVSDMKTFTLMWDNVNSPALPTNASSIEVRNAVLQMLSAQCPDAVAKQKESASVKYFRNYETDYASSYYGGTVTTETEAFCGRYSLKNQQLVYDYNEPKQGTTSTYSYISLTIHSKLCFAYKGYLTNVINLIFQYEDSKTPGSTSSKNDNFDYVFAQGNSWTYTCISLLDLVKTKYSGTNFKVQTIRLPSNQQYYIDVLYIGQSKTVEDLNVNRRRPALSGNGIFIQDASVTLSVAALKSQYTITLTPNNCGCNFPLFAAAFGENTFSNSKSAIYSIRSVTQNASIQINRTQAASPPIGGTFSIQAYGRQTKDLAIDASAADIKYMLENIPGVGQVSTWGNGDCRGYSWGIKFLTVTGYHSLLQVDSSKVTGESASIYVFRSTNGGLLRQHLLGDVLRTQNKKPQVEVYINEIPSMCSGNCDYTWDRKQTPTIYSFTTVVREENELLIINGTGFSNSSDSYVTIGDLTCTILAINDTEIQCQIPKASAGTFPITVYISGLGYASSRGGNLTFAYQIILSSITPLSGSLAGGTLITIYGSGFSNNSTVELGGKKCSVVFANLTAINCITPAGAAGSANVTVFTNGFSKTLPNAFSFTSLAPTITGINPSTSSVLGNITLTISGSGFQDKSVDNAVFLRIKPCQLLEWTPTKITCLLPALPPGKYNVLVQVGNLGFAISSMANEPSVEYILEVSSIVPQYGSLYGGSRVTLTGSGFSDVPSDNEVKIGSLPCKVSVSSANKLICVIQSAGTVYTVTNQGKNSVYGVGYAWSPSSLVISTGDTVVWNWQTLPFIQGIGYRVFSVSDPANTTYDGISFNSGARVASGVFSYQFTSPGIYYYSSGYVNDGQSILMQGVINVIQISNQSSPVHVYVGGMEATYTSGLPPTTPPSDCITPDPVCSQSTFSIPSNTSIWFGYSGCYSPVIISITPKFGTIRDAITIRGSGFSNITCANKVSVGSYPCVVASADKNSITCQVDSQDTMDIGVAQLVSLAVNNLGNGINSLRNEMDRRFALLPHIDYITPTNGSVTGSTRITIHGSGFVNINGSIAVSGISCNIISVNYTNIRCDTQPSYSRSVVVAVTVKGIAAQCLQSCSFTYSSALTPVVSSVYPTVVRNATTIYINGVGFGNDVNDVNVYVGDIKLNVVGVNDTDITCNIDPIPAGNYSIKVIVLSKGLAAGTFTMNSPAEATLLTPSGSVLGGTLLLIQGNGFHPINTTVQVAGVLCQTTAVTYNSIQCITPPGTTAKTATVIIRVPSASYPSLSFSYSEAFTPTVTSVLPTTGIPGTAITLSGSGFGLDASKLTVSIGNTTCFVTAVSDSQLTCSVGQYWGGTFPITLRNEKGFARSSARFTYLLSITGVSPNEGSFGGGLMLTVTGSGFDSRQSKVFVCNIECKVNQERSNTSLLYCETARNDANTSTQSCNVIVKNGDYSAQMNNSFTYSSALTPVIYDVTPKRGGTAGGTRLTITGSQFSSDMSVVNVTVAQAVCDIESTNSTHIICTTNAQSPSQRTKVRVYIKDQGIAKMDNADFFYIDVWSSKYTWGGQSPPDEGSLAVITAGQTILLDVSTPVLKMLLIQGGTLVFDEADIELQSENILITDGGTLQIGTEGAPFQHKAIITLHGHLRSPELPLYGAKTLAVRQGILDLHGLPVPLTWSRLAQTAESGSSNLILQQNVTWKAGDEIVLASTGDRRSQSQNEKRTIQSVSADGKNITLTQPLLYKHLGISVTLPDGSVFEARAEVGLLTRNILVRGSTNVEWSETIPACPNGFNTGEFATQTCFQGRFGEEVGSDQFGGCIMFHAPQPDKLLSIGRIEYVEVFHAGQAFRLGRYPIHWHLMGDVQYKSYVRGCGIHQTYNRAVSIHNTHNLLVERNVIYDIMGGAFFIEDGIEHGNILQYNLAIFVQQSTSLLNDDVTPAAFWVTNPNNTIRHNAAAGGTHFGFWYRMHDNPDGPSYDPNICQYRLALGEFYNNTVHSQGWYGLWIFRNYFPMAVPDQRQSCYGYLPSPAIFRSFTTWNCQKGAEWVNGGAIQFHNFSMINNEDSGIETKRVVSYYVGGWGETNGAMLKNAIIVGHLDELGLGSNFCTARGITLPFDEGLTVSSVKFMNFDRPNCSAIAVASIAWLCTDRCGGWSVKFNGIQYFNSPNKAGFRWEHEVVLIDTDGTLTGKIGGKVIPASGLLDPSQCSQSSDWSAGFPGYVCNSSISFHRLAFNNPTPSSLLGKDVIISNSFGSSVVPYLVKRLTHPYGWMALLPNADSFNWYFRNTDFITDITYAATFYGFKSEDYVLMSHNLTQKADMFQIIDIRNGSKQPLSYANNSNGDWYTNDSTTMVTYLVSGKHKIMRRAEPGTLDATMLNTFVNFKAYQCYFQNCNQNPVAPVTNPGSGGTSSGCVICLWSDRSFWESSPENHNTVPVNGSSVVIPLGKWVIADIQIPSLYKLTIYGTLELRNLTDNSTTQSAPTFKTTVVSATYIFIQGGKLIGGTEDSPFQGELHIVLRGNHSTPELPLPNGLILGSKALGVFGQLELHGLSRSVYRTKLANTASAGSQLITVSEPVDWQVGEDILITTTSYSAWQTEIRQILNVSADHKTLTLNGSLSFNHSANTYQVPNSTLNYTLAADVALLTRNIKIIGEDYPGWQSESFGARVLVSTFTDTAEYRGKARIENVEFYHSGQEGYRDPGDPRYSLAFLYLEEISTNESYVRGCAFHHGFSPAIGVFYTNGLNIDDNVIYFTVGEGIRVLGERVNIRRNLVALAIWPGTYQGRMEVNNMLWHGGIEINEGTDIVLQNNVVAGFERVGYHIDGESCQNVANPNQRWFNNEAYGGLYGIFMNQDGLPDCTRIRGFKLWKCWDYGIYVQIVSSVQISDVFLADNGMGILTIIYKPPSVTHQISNKTVQISNSVLVGSSPDFDCRDVLTDTDPNIRLTSQHRSIRPLTGGRSGICWPTFASGHNLAPGYPNAGLVTYNAISGLMTVKDTTFVGYKSVCSGQSNVMFMTNPENEDLQHPVQVSGITMLDSSENHKVFIHRPDVTKANPSECVDMTCDAKRKALLKDLDGSFLGYIGAVVPQSEYQWEGDTRYGLGDYRIPKVMLTALNGSRIPVSQVAPYKGVIRDNTCVYMPTWESYKCSGLNYEMLVIESLDPDTETRRLSPVAVLADGYLDLINGPQDHVQCSGYSCHKRVSLFHAVVATNKTYQVYFTSTSPQKLRLKLLNTNNTNSVTVGIYYSNPQRLDVYVNNVFVSPNNIQWQGSTYSMKEPTYQGQYMPQLSSLVLGENYFDKDYNMLYVLVRGSTPIEIRTSPLIVISFNMPAMTEDQFYGEDLVKNLAAFLKIPANKIRITKIIREGSRRRKRAAGGLSVQVEISDPPVQETNSSNQTTSSNTTDTLTFTDFQTMSQNLASAAINGSLSSQLNVTVSSLSVSEPVPSPSDSAWSQVAADTVNRTQPSTGSYLATVSALKVVREPVAGLPGERLSQQPSVMAADSDGNCVSVSASAMTLTATLKYSNGTIVSDGLGGNVTISFDSCWANYTDLVLELPGNKYLLEFVLNNVNVQTRSFDARTETVTTSAPSTTPTNTSSTTSTNTSSTTSSSTNPTTTSNTTSSTNSTTTSRTTATTTTNSGNQEPDAAIAIYSPFQALLTLAVTLFTVNLLMKTL